MRKDAENPRPYELARVLQASFITLLLRPFHNGDDLTFPKKIGNYSYQSTIRKIGPKKSYKLAIYSDKKGNWAVAKLRNARVKDYHYFSLLNEVNLYQVLSAVMDRHQNDFRQKFSDVHIPKFITAQESGGRLVMLIQYIEGKSVDPLPIKSKVDIYFRVSDFLSYAGNRMTAKEKLSLSRRSVLNIVSLYPIVLLKSLVNFPNFWPSLLKGVPLFLLTVPSLIKYRREQLIHRDLHFLNILKNQNGLYLLDLQQCVFAEETQEWVTTLRYYWKEGPFYKIFLKEVLKRFSNRAGFYPTFQGLMINSVTHGLIDKTFSKTIIGHWLDFLNFALKPDYDEFVN